MINKMKKVTHWLMALLVVAMVMACDGLNQKPQNEAADRQMEAAYKSRDYMGLIRLADSLEAGGELSQAKAYYWRGYASDRMRQFRMAEFYWRASLDAAAAEKDYDTYAKTASRLANMLMLRRDYEGALKMAEPAAERLETLKCDTTSDYVNLLIYIGCCQAGVGDIGDETADGFGRAYKKHLENIEKNRTDEAYKNAIAGLINIAVACNVLEHYQAALKWTGHFGELLSEYEQRPTSAKDYLDKQLARFDIYQARALVGLDKPEEASKVYEAFLATDFSKTPEGRILANDYLVAAQRWDEAAYNYRSLDAHLGSAGYTIGNIKNMVLRKYQTNLQAGRRDSAIAVSLMICDSLENAFAQADKLEAEEQAIIVKKVEEMAQRESISTRQRQYMMMAIVGLVFLLLIGFMLWRRSVSHRHKQKHLELKKAYGELEEATSTREREMTTQRIAQDIRQSMLPGTLPQLKDISLYTSQTPGAMAGNDLCETIVRGDRLFFCVGNALGEGVQAAVTMAMAGAQFRSLTAFESAPERIVGAVNEVLADVQRRMTLLVGILDMTTGHLTYCNAGHNIPLLMDTEVNLLPGESCQPVGESSDNVYKSQEMTLDKGSMLFLYTDGLKNVENASQKMLGEKAVRGAALQALKLNPEPKSFIGQMLEAVIGFTGGTPQRDDITMLVLSRP